MNKRYVQLDHVDMIYDTRNGPVMALKDINLTIRSGEFINLIGHSGCGKSTLLNIIAGLAKVSRGTARCAGREISGPGPERAIVFQDHSLLPWMTCLDNVYLAVERAFRQKEDRASHRRRAREALELVGLGHVTHKHPDDLSGGMKRRVGIARALSMQPKVLLLDEPFAALDALTRAHLQDELLRITTALGSTVVMVTHDVEEAVLLSDRIVMMTNGPAAMVGDILEVRLPQPRNRRELADHPDYNHYRAEVLRFLHERRRKPDEDAA
jgi:nitrate/nitrite transport system ATP-binding protein